ncbi:hypothetical protein J6590_070388 [Homalodisca vitripennis]|nr:hypothetical protein J6590_070388 [Homalodisca vitripennis]
MKEYLFNTSLDSRAAPGPGSYYCKVGSVRTDTTKIDQSIRDCRAIWAVHDTTRKCVIRPHSVASWSAADEIAADAIIVVVHSPKVSDYLRNGTCSLITEVFDHVFARQIVISNGKLFSSEVSIPAFIFKQAMGLLAHPTLVTGQASFAMTIENAKAPSSA